MKRIKVRFNLSRGKNFMKWKVEYPDKTYAYYDATEAQLILHDCTLKNRRSTADKIYKGANKSVCAWVLCDNLDIKTEDFLKDEGYDRLKFNPKVKPYWVYKDELADGLYFKRIISIDFGLYCMNK